ncbi:MAG: sensor histidine kinase [Panacagrimonas sp.]
MRSGRFGWLAALFLCASSGLAAAPLVELLPGMAAVQIDQVQSLATTRSDPPPDDAAWQATSLPDRWTLSRPAHVGTVWYRFTVRATDAPQSPVGLVLPKVSMNADFWINGMLMGRQGRMDEPLTRHWNTPLLFQPPPAAWRPGDNRVHVRVKSLAGQDGGLGRLWLGPADAVDAIYRERKFWRSTLVLVGNISVIALGLFFLFIWARKRQEVHYGYFAVGTLFWGLSNSNLVITEPPLPDLAWEWLTHMAQVWGLLLLGLFGLRFASLRLITLEWSVLAFALVGALAMAVVPESWRTPVDLMLLVPVILLGSAGMIAVARTIRPRPLHDYVLFGLAAAATVAMGAHDWLLKAAYLPYEDSYALPFIAPVLLGAMSWLVAGEFARAQRNLAQLNQELGARVEEREKQLRDSYARLGESERERAVVAERARILRDMHDGVGAHLSAAIRQIETGSSSSADVAQSLRDSLDQLKLSVDAMNLPPGDVNALLASMRYRLQPRIQAAGLSLEWQVDPLPVWQQGNSAAMRHLQYMLFEVFSNALQHARARQLCLRALVEQGRIVVALIDDGQGFQVPPEQALRSLRERAALIGAELDIRTDSSGSKVSVTLA